MLPRAPELLEAWERGIGQGAVERGLTLLALACPEQTAHELAAVSVGERDRRLLALQQTLFGPDLHAVASCPRCAEQLEMQWPAAALQAAPPSPPPGSLRLQSDRWDLILRLPDSTDLLAVSESPDEGERVLVRRCVSAGEEWPASADALPPELIERAGALLAEADPQADLRLSLSCPECGHSWDAPFDAVSFLWAELDGWAERMLCDVHVLALHYNWAERDILGLSATRRQAYLRMLEE